MGRHRYQLLSSDQSPKSGFLAGLWSIRGYILAALASSLLTWVITFQSVNGKPTVGTTTVIPLDSTTQTFRYDRQFAEGSARTDEAWETLFPLQGGFFQHPTIAPNRSGLSVFHQLHCLNGIRKSYWQMYEAAQSSEPLDTGKMDHMLGPSHIRHCIDLLRQSMMCQPDLTVELVDPAIKASKGFGVQHICKDYSQLLSFMKEWQERRNVKPAGPDSG